MKNAFAVIVCCVMSYYVAGGCLARQTIKVNEQSGKKVQGISTSGGNGESYDSAVVLTGGKDHAAAVESEHKFIAKLWGGVQDKDWKITEQTIVTEGKKTYDMVQVEVIGLGEKHFYYFDITWYTKKAKRPQNLDDAK
jgi:hypothetical protein